MSCLVALILGACAGAGSQAGAAPGAPEEVAEMSSYQRALAAAPEGAAVIAVEGFAPGGYDLYWIDTSSADDGDSGYGLAVGERVLSGAEAFRAASPGLAPAELARLAMLLLDGGGEPLLAAETEAQRAAGVAAPSVEGGVLTYWSERSRLSAPGLRRHRLELGSLSLENSEAAAPEDRAAAIERQAALLRDPSSFARAAAVRALGPLCAEDAALQALIGELEAGPWPETRAAIAGVLAGCPGAEAALMAALSDAEGRVRAAAAASLGALAAGGSLDPASADALRAALESVRDGDADPDARGAARRALAGLR